MTVALVVILVRELTRIERARSRERLLLGLRTTEEATTGVSRRREVEAREMAVVRREAEHRLDRRFTGDLDRRGRVRQRVVS
ncbi:MAG: hypothetical protein ABI591_09020 [Kofleriaceae bacterium]